MDNSGGTRADDKKFIKWARKVKERDEFVCQVCFDCNTFLNAHHINSWDAFPELRYDLKNGITLCQNCHDSFHGIFGYGQNDEFQFNQFRIIYADISKHIEKQAKKEEIKDGYNE